MSPRARAGQHGQQERWRMGARITQLISGRAGLGLGEFDVTGKSHRGEASAARGGWGAPRSRDRVTALQRRAGGSRMGWGWGHARG